MPRSHGACLLASIAIASLRSHAVVVVVALDVDGAGCGGITCLDRAGVRVKDALLVTIDGGEHAIDERHAASVPASWAARTCLACLTVVPFAQPWAFRFQGCGAGRWDASIAEPALNGAIMSIPKAAGSCLASGACLAPTAVVP
jgi:hypothetical protein